MFNDELFSKTFMIDWRQKKCIYLWISYSLKIIG